MKKSKNLVTTDSTPKLKTGDIVLFSGHGPISTGIKIGTASRWSHVGMIVRIADFDMVAVWESTTLKTVKDSKSTYVKGVQLNQLRERIIQYNGDIAIRRLEGIEFSSEDLKKLSELRRELTGRPYEKNKLDLIKAAYDGPGGANKEDLSSIFCSELVAEAYQTLGLLPETLASSEFVPADFSEARDKKLKLLKGRLGPEIVLKDV